jgi:hypothetical protein
MLSPEEQLEAAETHQLRLKTINSWVLRGVPLERAAELEGLPATAYHPAVFKKTRIEYTPLPEEIQERAAEVRQGWTEDTYIQRRR